jgi:hypothetical protein
LSSKEHCVAHFAEDNQPAERTLQKNSFNIIQVLQIIYTLQASNLKFSFSLGLRRIAFALLRENYPFFQLEQKHILLTKQIKIG